MDLLLYGRDSSYNVQMVLWLLQELDLPYQHVQLGGRYGGIDTAEFSALNPMQKVPVLIDGGHSIWESNTILRYLVEAYGSPDWKANNAYQRSEFERWMDWSQCKFEPAFVGVFWGYFRTPPELRDLAAIEQSVDDCLRCLNCLDRQLAEQSFLLGDSLTLADVCCGAFIYRLVEIDLSIRLPPKVAQWYARLKSLPAYQQWVMRDFSELAGRLAF